MAQESLASLQFQDWLAVNLTCSDYLARIRERHSINGAQDVGGMGLKHEKADRLCLVSPADFTVTMYKCIPDKYSDLTCSQS